MILDTQINTATVVSGYGPSITAFNDGGFVVSWTSVGQDGSDWGVYAQRYDANGMAQDSEFRVNTTTLNYQSTSSVTAFNDGGFVVSWSSGEQDSDLADIIAQRYDAHGVALGSEFRVNTAAGEQFPSAITALSDDGFVVIWQNPQAIWGKRYDTNGNKIEWVSADRLFNWAESIYDNLFPNHPASQEIEGYHARIYENGNALGEQNENIYFYDGHSIVLVGTVYDFLPDALSAGF